MAHRFRIQLLLSFLAMLLLLPLAAEAKLTIGVVPAAGGLFASEAQAYRFAAVLEGVLAEEVRVRLFANEATLNEWLTRFRQVDLAVFSRSYLERRPSGEFILVAEYFRRKAPRLSPDLIVARQGRDAWVIQRVQDVLLGMDSQSNAQQVLKELGVLRFALPGMPVPEEPVAVPEPTRVKPAATEVARPQPVASPAVSLRSDEHPEVTDRPSRPAPAVSPKETAAPKVSRQAAQPVVKPKKTEVKEPVPMPVVEPVEPVATVVAPAPEPETVSKPSSAQAVITPVGTSFLIFSALTLVALLAAAGYMLWQLRRLNRVMEELVGQMPETDVAGE